MPLVTRGFFFPGGKPASNQSIQVREEVSGSLVTEASTDEFGNLTVELDAGLYFFSVNNYEISFEVQSPGSEVQNITVNNKTGPNIVLEAEDVGAAPASHGHSAGDVGAASAGHSHSAGDVGAAPENHSHNVLQSTGFAESGMGSGLNRWSKVLSMTLGSQYNDATVAFTVIAAGDGSDLPTFATLAGRIRQGEPMGQAPAFSLAFLQGSQFVKEDFKIAVTEATTEDSTIEIWMRHRDPWAYYNFQQISYAGSADLRWSYGEANQPDAPAGAVVATAAV